MLRVQCPWPLVTCSPVCPIGALCCLCGVLGHLAPVHRCAHSLRCVACALSWAICLLFAAVPAKCLVLRVRCPWPLGSCSLLCLLGALSCVCGTLGHLAAVHRFARSVCCAAFAASLANWLLFTGVPARSVVLRVRCPWPLGSCSRLCLRGVMCCVSGVLGHLDSVHSVPTLYVVLRVRCPGRLGSCSPVCPLDVLCCVRGVLGHLTPAH